MICIILNRDLSDLSLLAYYCWHILLRSPSCRNKTQNNKNQPQNIVMTTIVSNVGILYHQRARRGGIDAFRMPTSRLVVVCYAEETTHVMANPALSCYYT